MFILGRYLPRCTGCPNKGYLSNSNGVENFDGAREFNKLPNDIRRIESFMLFKRALKVHFKIYRVYKKK